MAPLSSGEQTRGMTNLPIEYTSEQHAQTMKNRLGGAGVRRPAPNAWAEVVFQVASDARFPQQKGI
jgi:hypothetical protein